MTIIEDEKKPYCMWVKPAPLIGVGWLLWKYILKK